MKIKQVCEQTGLTDRTVRYYIEEKLISPYYTENYMGRKAYDFSATDMTMLENIAVLRKVGFTVEEIRQLIQSPANSQEIIRQVRRRKEEAAETEQETFALLDRLGRLTDYTVSSLVEALGEAAERAKLPPEKYRPDAYEVCGMLLNGAVYAAVMLAPPAFLIRWLCWFWKYHRYAAFGAGNALCILLALLPTAALLIAWLKPEWIRRRWRAWVLCLLYLPFSWGCAGHMLGDSVTTDIRYYRVWDFYLDEGYGQTGALFPAQIRQGWDMSRSIYEDSDYFYRARAEEGTAVDSFWGQTVSVAYDIYAEWTIPQDLLTEEVARVSGLFEKLGNDPFAWYASQGQKGDFTYWIMDFMPVEDHDPFSERWKGGSIYMMFAYDKKTGRVRYGVGRDFRDIWPDFPHFREVDWGEEAAP